MIIKNKRIKVYHLSTVHPSYDTRIFYKECKNLVKAGYYVTLIAQHDRNEMIDGIKIIALPKAKNRIHRIFCLTIKAFCLALKKKAAIYHFHDPELIPIGVLLKLLGNKVIYDVHEDVSEDILTKDWIPIVARRLIARIFWIFEKYIVKCFSLVITATPFLGEKFFNAGCHTVTVNNYPIKDELYIQDSEWSKKDNVVVYVGAICDFRGIYEMIEAIGQTEARLLLCGYFSPDEQRTKAMSLSGWAKVEELGQVERYTLAKTLQKAKAGLVLFHPVSNHLDALPNKMFEYMSAEIPVIASNFTAWKEIIEGNKCGICVDPLSPIDIAEAICWIMTNPDEAKSMGENGRQAVVEKYNWENEWQKLRESYKVILH
ncbi:glycosyltransferase family 4 protein [Bacteroidota bacterium]